MSIKASSLRCIKFFFSFQWSIGGRDRFERIYPNYSIFFCWQKLGNSEIEYYIIKGVNGEGKSWPSRLSLFQK